MERDISLPFSQKPDIFPVLKQINLVFGPPYCLTSILIILPIYPYVFQAVYFFQVSPKNSCM
jgi:hypothetical protein